MSPLPQGVTRSGLDRLGKRLRDAEQPADEDLDQLQEVLVAYEQALAEVQRRMTGLGLAPTARLKTTGVLIDKLRRERSSLKSVQDIAGARVTVEDVVEQDEVVSRLVAEFDAVDATVRVKDRRAEPTHGYRAVHLVVSVQGLPVEIQVRTIWQDQWAQIVESLGDRWGRGIRYGESPPDVEDESRSEVRQQVWQVIQQLSNVISAVEGGAKRLDELERQAAGPQSTEVDDEWRRARNEALEAKAEVEATVDETLQLLIRAIDRL